MANLIKEVTKHRLRLVPDQSSSFVADPRQSDCEFDIKVINAGKQFASFQVELLMNGTDPDSNLKWYSVEPEICSKMPPGDISRFRVVITKSPLPTYDTTLPVTIKVFSIESELLVDTRTIELSIKKPESPLKVYLPIKDLKVYPGDKLDIPVLVHNLSPKFAQVTLTLDELSPDWFVKPETRKIVQVGIDAGNPAEVLFCCSPPKTPSTESRVYDFLVRVEDHNQNSASCSGSVEVLSYGIVKFECPEPYQLIPQPSQSPDLQAAKSREIAEYKFHLSNLSNLKQLVAIKLLESGNLIDDIDTLPRVEIEPGNPEPVTIIREIKQPRPWWGRSRVYRFEAVPDLVNAHSGQPSDPIYAEPNIQTLDLEALPRIPFWLQLLGGLFVLLGLGLLWYLTPSRSPHRAPVNSVRIIGNETTVVSGSSDRTVLRWDISPIPWIVNHRRLSYREPIADASSIERAVRVIREIPQRENQIAVGLENGEIQLWQISPPGQRDIPIYEQKDRVFDLGFTPDSRYLFSGHGSGLVRQWDLDETLQPDTLECRNKSREDSEQEEKKNKGKPWCLDFRGAVSALSVIDLGLDSSGLDRSVVAIAGQFDRFVLWDWQRRIFYTVNYQRELYKGEQKAESPENRISPVRGKYDYINSLSAAKNASVLAMSDNRGYITLWNTERLRQCIDTFTNSSTRDEFGYNYGNSVISLPCSNAEIEQWQASRAGQSVRAVGLSDNGCYLASVGDDGRVVLWFPQQPSRRSPDVPDSLTIEAFANTPLRTVDIKQPAENYVLIASNAPENQVRLYRQTVDPQNSCPASMAEKD